MLMTAAFLFAGMTDPLHLLFGLGSGALAAQRASALWTVPLLLAFSVGATWAMESYPIPADILVPMIAGRAVAFLTLNFIGFEVGRWWKRCVQW